jgi:hypothetical protein
MRARRKVHTCPLDLLIQPAGRPEFRYMPKRDLAKDRIENLVKEAAKPYPHVWRDDD